MAKSKRHGKKSAAKKAKRKSAKRKANARKLVRFNELRREGYGKAEAKRIAYGKGKKGKKGGGKKGRKGKGGKSKRHGAHKGGHGSVYKAALADIQKQYGTTGWPPTAEEREMARLVASGWASDRRSPSSEAEKLKAEFEAKRRKLIKERAAQKMREQERANRERAKQEAEEAAEREFRDL